MTPRALRNGALSTPRRRAAAAWRGSEAALRPSIACTRSMRSSSLRQVLADELAVAQDGDAVADLVDLVEEVRDEQDRHAALLEVADDAEQLGALVEVQARGRLVEDEHPDVGRDRPRDRDQLLDRQRVRAQDRGRVDVQPEVGEHGAALARASPRQSISPNRRGSRPSAMFSATERFGSRSISW